MNQSKQRAKVPPGNPLVRHFGRLDSKELWEVQVWDCPAKPFYYSYAMKIGVAFQLGGLDANPLLHGCFGRVTEAVEAGERALFRRAGQNGHGKNRH